MLRIRYAFFMVGVLLVLLYSPAQAQVSIRIWTPNLSIGINVPSYPHLVVIPGYPVYYAPGLHANYFFYDGLYWVFYEGNWYASSWYDGPWGYVHPDSVPVFILRIPVRYYRNPPPFFHGWHPDAPPHWGAHWGPAWERNRSGWDRWDHRAVPAPAPLPRYQQNYGRDRYPHQLRQQQQLEQRYYRFQPREPAVRRYFQERSREHGPAVQSPQPRDRYQQTVPQSRSREQQIRKSNERGRNRQSKEWWYEQQ